MICPVTYMRPSLQKHLHLNLMHSGDTIDVDGSVEVHTWYYHSDMAKPSLPADPQRLLLLKLRKAEEGTRTE